MATIYDGLFPLGLGTLRFKQGRNNIETVDNAVKLILRALDYGVEYIDTSHSYIDGLAHKALKEVFAATKRSYAVTVKSQFYADRDSDGARRGVEHAFKEMGIEYAEYFLVWSIRTYDEYTKVMAKDGIYCGAKKLKDEGYVGHICASLHTPLPETIKIIEQGAFEGITLSYSIMNSILMQPVLDLANEKELGLVAMNPLGGGIVPKNQEYFEFLRGNKFESIPQAALRFVSAQPAIKIVLTGAENETQFNENLNAFTNTSLETSSKRIDRVHRSVKQLNGFCTGCQYCEPCQMGIPVSKIMQSRNELLFTENQDEDLAVFRRLSVDYSYIPINSYNPCVKCGSCEKKCTQHLNIISSLTATYNRVNEIGYSYEYRKKRIDMLLNGKPYSTVALWPSGGSASVLIEYYKRFFGEPKFKIILINSDETKKGTIADGVIIHSPSELPKIKPNAVLICSYRYANDINNELKRYNNLEFDVLQLYFENDIPWA